MSGTVPGMLQGICFMVGKKEKKKRDFLESKSRTVIRAMIRANRMSRRWREAWETLQLSFCFGC